MTLIPVAGGKIRSLFDRVRQREWLWTSPVLRIAPPDVEASYVASHDSGGIDECFPGVSPGDIPGYPGYRVPDHGEWWALPWEVQHESGSSAEMVAYGERFPVEIRRRITLSEDAPVVRLEYGLTSRLATRMPTVYCLHPLFAIENGTRVVISPDFEVRVSGGTVPGLVSPDSAFTWPRVGPYDLSTLDPDAGVALKVWGESPATGQVALEHPGSRSRLVIRWNPDELPHLGLWINQGGWTGVPGAAPYANIGIEPGWGGVDGLDEAVTKTGTAWWLEPGETRRWTIEIAIEELT